MKQIKENYKWQVQIGFGKAAYRIDPFHRMFYFGIFKIHTMPKEGSYIGKKEHYKGFRFVLNFFWPFEVDQWC